MNESRTSDTGSLSALDLAAGTALEPLRGPALTTPQRSGPTARKALEGLLLEGMQAGRSNVSFLGVSDSSLILALACSRAARGFRGPGGDHDEAPFRGLPGNAWQELAISRLGVRDWQRINTGDTGDLLGTDATTVVLRFGIQFPSDPAYMHLAIARAAQPGTILTGVGGDELLGGRAWRVARLLWRRRARFAAGRPRPGSASRSRRAGCGDVSGPAGCRTRRHRGCGLMPGVRSGRCSPPRRCARGCRVDVGALDFAQTRTDGLSQQALKEVGSALRGRHHIQARSCRAGSSRRSPDR